MEKYARPTVSLALSVLVVFSTWCSTAASAQSTSLDIQARCATLASSTLRDLEREFQEEIKSSLVDTTDSLMGHESHYDSLRKKCFVLFTRTVTFNVVGDTEHAHFSVQTGLIEAPERRYLASYITDQVIGLQRTEPRQQTCELTPTRREKTLCKTRDEFDAFISSYMGN
jgi:hypothetical protein